MSFNGRLLIVSNRLPVTVRVRGGSVQLVRSTGGLATGLDRFHTESGGLWFGWPGDTSHLEASQLADVERLMSERGLRALHLTRSEVSRYYEGFSNGVIWPLFHYLLDRIPLDARDWGSYRRINERFADFVAAEYRTGDAIWVHDYQLTLVPGYLRQRLPDAPIGFFLHIPFPAHEVFRTLPWRQEVLEGLLGADLIGFHTYAYQRHFAVSVRHILGLDVDTDRLRVDSRDVRLGTFPMGIDVEGFQRLAEDPEVVAEANAIRAETGGRKILLGVDRLDYTKGIPRRVLAFERLLEQSPELRDRVRLIQLAVPSRTGVEHYREFRRQLDGLVGRVNGLFGSASWTPIHYLYRSVSPRQLVSLYRAADVMLVTALRDGMNLVAKEFVASRVDENGVLLLSEFAGASAELAEALLVNPYDTDGLTRSMRRALTMDPVERRNRMRALRRRVISQDVRQWAQTFLDRLPEQLPSMPRPIHTAPEELAELIDRIRAAPCRALLLDYDGTLVPFANAPELAAPDPELLELLEALAATAGSAVHLISGRPADTLQEWFGRLPVGLWAEHGLIGRRSPEAPWVPTIEVERAWMETVRPTLERFVASTAGSLLEEKAASLAWHYRMVDPDLGRTQAEALRRALAGALNAHDIEILEGSRVLELRPRGINKGLVVRHILASAPGLLVALGDDTTDEEMFAALPPEGVAVHVGPRATQAYYRLPDVRAARAFLRSLSAFALAW